MGATMLLAVALASAAAAPRPRKPAVGDHRHAARRRVGAYGCAGCDARARRLARGRPRRGRGRECRRRGLASILTGLLPYEHGVRDNFAPLETRFVTLAERLRGRAGHSGFVSAYPSGDSRLDQGFERFDDPFGSQGKREPRQRSEPRRRSWTASAWAASARGPSSPGCTSDPHWPYEPPAARAVREEPIRRRVAYADTQLARLLEWLGARANVRRSWS
jgi:hypothetical protein